MAVMAKYRVVFPADVPGGYAGLHAFAGKYEALLFLRRAARHGIDWRLADLHPEELQTYIDRRMKKKP
jgi:hypothetical protein